MVTSGQHTAHTDTQHTHKHTHTQSHRHSQQLKLHVLSISILYILTCFPTSHYLFHFSWSFFFCSFLINFEFLSQIITCKRAIFFVHIPWKQMWLGYMYMCIYTNRTVFWVVYQCAISIYSCKQRHISLLIIFSIQQNMFSMVWWIKTFSTNIKYASWIEKKDHVFRKRNVSKIKYGIPMPTIFISIRVDLSVSLRHLRLMCFFLFKKHSEIFSTFTIHKVLKENLNTNNELISISCLLKYENKSVVFTS